jgi:hypothetical protein
MLHKRGQHAATSTEEQTIAVYQQHLQKVERFLASRSCFSTLKLNYRDALDRPEDAARRLREFVGRPLNVEEMARVADPTLYRNRAS